MFDFAHPVDVVAKSGKSAHELETLPTRAVGVVDPAKSAMFAFSQAASSRNQGQVGVIVGSTCQAVFVCSHTAPEVGMTVNIEENARDGKKRRPHHHYS